MRRRQTEMRGVVRDFGRNDGFVEQSLGQFRRQRCIAQDGDIAKGGEGSSDKFIPGLM